MDIVTPGIGLIFWSFITFILLVILLKKFAWKPILTIVQDREQSIKQALEAANEARKEVQNLKADSAKIINDARKDCDQMLLEAREVKNHIVSKAKEEALKESQKIIENANKLIRQERQEAIKELRSQVAELSLTIAQKILEDELSNKDKHLHKIKSLISETSLN